MTTCCHYDNTLSTRAEFLRGIWLAGALLIEAGAAADRLALTVDASKDGASIDRCHGRTDSTVTDFGASVTTNSSARDVARCRYE